MAEIKVTTNLKLLFVYLNMKKFTEIRAPSTIVHQNRFVLNGFVGCPIL